MSLEYELRIVTDWQPSEILKLLARELKLESEESRLFGPGIVLGVTPETDDPHSIMMETFGFQPTVDVWFWLDSQENYQRGKQILLEATMLVLKHLSGDAVLLFNSEYSGSHIHKVQPSPQTPLPRRERGFEKYLTNPGTAIYGIAANIRSFNF